VRNRRERVRARRQETFDEMPTIQGQLVPLEVSNAILDIPRIVLPEVKPKSNIPLVILAYSLGIVGLGINGWFAWSRGTTLIDKGLLSLLGLITEAMAFYLPIQASRLWIQRQVVGFVFASLVCVVLLLSAVINGLGFASLNLNETSTARAERITPAVADAQRKLDTRATSRKDECLRRGDKCRQLEKDEQQALEALREAREKVSETSDPQTASAAKLVAWVSQGRFHPSTDDFAMLRLLLLTCLPQLGGLILMVSTIARS